MFFKTCFFIFTLTIIVNAPLAHCQTIVRKNSLLEKISDKIFPKTTAYTQTNALVVMKNNKIIYEKYENGFSQNSSHITWSISKSITAILIGIAVEQHKIKTTQSICDFFITFKNTAYCKITVDHLLSWSSGLTWNEMYERESSRTKSSVGQLLFGDGAYDMMGFVLSHPLAHEPGTVFQYSSGDSTLLMAILQKVYPEEKTKLPWKLLFQPLGITTAIWELDEQENFGGGTSLYISAQDLLKIADLLLNNGNWHGKQLLPKNWIASLTTHNPNHKITNPKFSVPGRHFWFPSQQISQTLAKAGYTKNNIYMALGHWGQDLIILPSLKTAVVRFGNDHGQTHDLEKLLLNVIRIAK